MENNKFVNFLASFDFTGDQITFSINKQDSPKTLMGGILSSIILLFSTVFFIVNIQVPLNKTNPNISSYMNINPNPEPFILNSTSLPFAFAVTSETGKFYNDIIQVEGAITYFQMIKGAGIYEDILIPATQCKPENLPGVDLQEFEEFGFRNYLCFDNQNITLEGINTSGTQIFLIFYATYCGINSNNNTSCDIETQRQKLKEIDDGGIYFSVFFLNNIFTPFNYKNHKKKYIENIYPFLDFDLIKYTEIYLSRYDLITDDGILWNTENKDSIISKDEVSFQNFLPNYDYNSIAISAVFISGKEYTSIRSYKKIPSVMADIMGLFQYLKFAIKCIFSISNLNGKIRLMNSIFEFDLKNHNKKKGTHSYLFKLVINNNIENEINHKNLNKLSVSNKNHLELKIQDKKIKSNERVNSNDISQVGSSIDINLSYSNSNNHNKFVGINKNPRQLDGMKNNEVVDDVLTKINHKDVEVKAVVKDKDPYDYCKLKNEISEKKNIRFSKSEMIRLNFFRYCLQNKKLKRKYSLYQIGEEKLEEKLEISNVINKLEEIEKLKAVLLDKQQLAMFSLISKELCSNSQENLQKCELTKLMEFQKDQEKINPELEKYKIKLKNVEQEFETVNEKLLILLPLEIRELLKNN